MPPITQKPGLIEAVQPPPAQTSVVQASPSNTAPTGGVGSVLPLHQGYAALKSSAGSILAVSGGAEHLSLAHDVGAPSRTPWAQRVMTPNAARVQRAPPAPASAPVGASTSVSSTGSQASPAAQTSAQSMTPESIDLERVASAVYRIIRDRLIVERESRGL